MFAAAASLRRTVPLASAPTTSFTRHMSRLGKMPIKIPTEVTVRIEDLPDALLPPFIPYNARRAAYAPSALG